MTFELECRYTDQPGTSHTAEREVRLSGLSSTTDAENSWNIFDPLDGRLLCDIDI